MRSNNPFADDDSPQTTQGESTSPYNHFAAPTSFARDSAASASNPFAAPSASSSSAASRDYNPFAATSTPPERERASHARAPSSSSSSSATSASTSDGASAMASYYAQLAAAPPTLAPPPAASVTRKPSVSAASSPSVSTTSSASTSHAAAPASAPSTSSSPVFRLEALDGWKPTKEQGRIVHVAAGNDVLCIATSTNWLIRWSVEREEVEPILLSKRVDDAVHRVFVDPFGHHCLVAMAHGSTYYLHSKWSKAHTLSKLKGVLIDSVAWHTADGESATTSSSGRILLGTSTGLIYEAVLDSVDKDKNVRKLYDLNAGDAGDGGVGPVCGLAMELFPAGSDSAEDKWVIIAATPRRQYEFIGGPTAAAIFERYQSSPAAGFLELPGTLSYTELRLNAKYGKDGAGGKDSEPAKAAAWLTGAGIYYSQVRYGQQSEVGEHVLEDGKLLSYPEDDTGARTPPLSCALTEFHLVLLNNSRLTAINQLSKEVVWEQAYKNHTDLLGFAYNACKSGIWTYSSRAVEKLSIEHEKSGIWKLFLQQGKFDEASQYADSKEDKQTVKLAQADELFASKLYQQAAKLYAETNKQFEEIALKFVQISGDGLPGQKPAADEMATGGGGSMSGMNGTSGVRAARSSTSSLDARAALKIYLLEKFSRLPATHRTQQTMICTWLTEIFLDNINRLRSVPPIPALTQATGTTSLSATFALLRDDDPYASLSADERNDLCEAEVEQFRTFLADCSNCLDPATTIALLSSHGRMREWLQYASNDLEWVLTQHVQEQQWKDALGLLRQRADPTNQAELFYKFVPAIITHLPADTVDTLCEKKQLDPAKLIPALMRYEELPQSHPSAPVAGGANQAVRYLEHAVYRFRTRDPVVHNYLLSLYAGEADNKPFLRYPRLVPRGRAGVRHAVRAARVLRAQPARGVRDHLCADGAVRGGGDAGAAGRHPAGQARHPAGGERQRPVRARPAHHQAPVAAHRPPHHRLAQRRPAHGHGAAEGVRQPAAGGHAAVLPRLRAHRRAERRDQPLAHLVQRSHRRAAGRHEQLHTAGARHPATSCSSSSSATYTFNTNRKCDRCALPALSQPFLLFPCTHTLHVECAKQEWRAYWDKHPQPRGGGLRWSAMSTRQKESAVSQIASDCCLCGSLMVDSVQLPFVAEQDAAEQREIGKWRI